MVGKQRSGLEGCRARAEAFGVTAGADEFTKRNTWAGRSFFSGTRVYRFSAKIGF
jgi:hypothetical protein